MDLIDSVYWGLRENLLGTHSFVRIVLNLSRCLLEDLSLLQCIRRHYMAINALPSKEAEPDYLCSQMGIDITRTRHNVTYNVLCRLVLNWPVVELVTSVYSIYQHRPSRGWSVFLSPDRVTPDGMPHGRIYTIWLCTHYHRIDVANFTKCFSETQIFVIVVPKRFSPQKAAYCYRLFTALCSRKNTFVNVAKGIPS